MSAAPPRASVHRWRPGRLVGLLAACAASIIASRPFWPGELLRNPWMTWVRDDFFYYLVIARNLATGHGSTFSGTVPTNGYHPLWLLLLTALLRISAAPRWILAFVALSSVAAVAVVYAFSLRIFRAAGISGVIAAILAAYLALNSLDLFFYGMEVTLALPAALALSAYLLGWNPARGRRWWAGAGLLVSLMALARLDSLPLAALMGLFLLLSPSWRRSLTPARLAALGAGLLPLVIYFLFNRVHFGLWSPVSGLAKQLRWSHWPAASVWLTVYYVPRFARLNLLVAVTGLLLFPFVLRKFSAVQQAVLAALLIFPWLLVLLLSIRSDWELWPWYHWIFRVGLCGGLAVWFRALAVWFGPEARVPEHRFPFAPFLAWAPQVLAGVVLLATLVRIATLAWIPGQLDFYQTAEDVRAFAQTHPGVYAMGDRAGMTAYLLSYPVVQAEGLAMDRAFLGHIRRQDDLRATLRQYGARYYVGTAWDPYTGCFQAIEPIDAGDTSPHLRSTFCQQPLQRTEHDGIQTLIFDLAQP